MGTYSNAQIVASIENGDIVCVPFSEERVEYAGLFVTLGAHYYRTEQSTTVVQSSFGSEADEQYFDGPFKALSHAQQCSLSGIRPLANLDPDHPVILVRPGERIITHSHEFIAAPTSTTACLVELANWQQNGIVVAPGFDNLSRITRLSIIIRNVNTQTSIILPVGAPIARLVFGMIGDAHTESQQPPTPTEQIDTAISTWAPSSMLAPPKPLPDKQPSKIQGQQYD